MIATKKAAPRRVTVNGASTNQQGTSTTSGRCVQCGRSVARLVAVCEGFASLGWCERCNRANQQPEFEGVGQ